MGQVLNVVVEQSPGNLIGRQARLDWLKQAIDLFGDQSVDLLLLPELFLTGYNIAGLVKERASLSNSHRNLKFSIAATTA